MVLPDGRPGQYSIRLVFSEPCEMRTVMATLRPDARVAAWWLLLASALTSPIQGQYLRAPEGRQYQLDAWRAQDGVRLAFTSNLVQTREGYLWLSTQSGLTRFDGFCFRVFDHVKTPVLRGRPNLQTYPLVEGSDGVLWIATDVGLLTYTAGSIRPAATDSSLSADLVHAATVDSAGGLWAITRGGRVLRIGPGGQIVPVSGTDPVYQGGSIATDAAGNGWSAFGTAVLYRLQGDGLMP